MLQFIMACHILHVLLHFLLKKKLPLPQKPQGSVIGGVTNRDMNNSNCYSGSLLYSNERKDILHLQNATYRFNSFSVAAKTRRFIQVEPAGAFPGDALPAHILWDFLCKKSDS